MNSRFTFALIVAVATALIWPWLGVTQGLAQQSDAAWIYFAQDDTISRVRRDGSEVVELHQAAGPVTSLAVHDGHLYWSEGQGSATRVVRAPLSGAAGALQEQVLAEETGAHAVAAAGDRLYWSVASSNEGLRTANLDGSEAKTLRVDHLASAGAVAAIGDAVFQVDRVFDKIARIDADGAELRWIKGQPEANREFYRRSFAERPDRPGRLALSTQHVYWTVWNNEKIVRLDLSAGEGDPEVVLEERDVAGALIFDRQRRELIWVESSPWSIWRLKVDGEDRHQPTKLVERTYPEHLAVHGEWVFWSEIDTSGPLVLASLYRCRIDSCNPEQIVDADAIGGPGNVFDQQRRAVVVPAPSSLVALENRLYWTEHESRRLLSSALDGSDLVILRDDIGSRDQIAKGDGALYLHRPDEETLERLPLSGESLGAPELILRADLATESFAVNGSALYYVDQLEDRIARVALALEARPVVVWSATTTEDDPPEPSLPASIAGLAVGGDRLFWTEHTSGRVVSSALDGSDVRTHAENAVLPNAVAANSADVYWSEVRGLFTVPLSGGSEPRQVLRARGITAFALSED